MPRKKLLAFMLIAAMAATAMPVGAFADTVTGDIHEITEADLDENNQKDVSLPVEYTVDATFTVKLPSAITLSNTDGSWRYSGKVGVKGDIDSGKSVKVRPSSSVTMYDVTCRPTDDVPASAEDQAYEHKDAKDVAVAQTKKQWTMTELSADTYSDTDLTLTAGAMQSGKWKGKLNVNISYGEYIEPGLYGSAGAFTPWDDLVSAGTVTMSGNVLERCKTVSGKMVIPDSVTSIGDSAFYNCKGLTSITISDSVTSIGNCAFYNCTGLTSISIPDSVTSIDLSAFQGCESLTSVNIPESVTSIGSWAFVGCSGLTSITVAEGNTKYDSRNNCNAIIEKETNTLIVGCKNTVIPDGVTSIGNGAFEGCSGLTSITIPSSVTSIENSAFQKCTGLTSITIPSSVTSIGNSAFSSCSGLTSITIPDSVTSIGDSAFYYCSGLTNITIPDGVTSIENEAFNGCRSLTSITIPDSMTSIGEYAFSNCRGLTSITFTGTQEQWSAITKVSNWNIRVPATVVHCTDGDITL